MGLTVGEITRVGPNAFAVRILVGSDPAGEARAVELLFLEGDICSYGGDAIVNAANDHLWMGSGVAGAIKRAAGPSVEAEARSRGPIPRGSAVVTSPGNLPVKGIIHGAVMGQDLVTHQGLIDLTTRSALRACVEHRFRRVAFPALGTGVGGFPMRRCGAVMVRAVVDFLASQPSALDEVAFFLFGQEALREFLLGAAGDLGVGFSEYQLGDR